MGEYIFAKFQSILCWKSLGEKTSRPGSAITLPSFNPSCAGSRSVSLGGSQVDVFGGLFQSILCWKSLGEKKDKSYIADYFQCFNPSCAGSRSVRVDTVEYHLTAVVFQSILCWKSLGEGVGYRILLPSICKVSIHLMLEVTR